MSWTERLFSRREEPHDPPTGDADRIAEVEEVLAEMRPHFQADGGDIRLTAVDDDGWVDVSMFGACNGCHMSSMTLRGALEPELKRRLPWVLGLRSS